MGKRGGGGEKGACPLQCEFKIFLYQIGLGEKGVG
jgi:hypothetical protein